MSTASSLKVNLYRMVAHDLDCVAYWMELQNARCVGGRSLNVRHPVTFEDVVALHQATGEIVRREKESTTVVADRAGSHKVEDVKE